MHDNRTVAVDKTLLTKYSFENIIIKHSLLIFYHYAFMGRRGGREHILWPWGEIISGLTNIQTNSKSNSVLVHDGGSCIRQVAPPQCQSACWCWGSERIDLGCVGGVGLTAVLRGRKHSRHSNLTKIASTSYCDLLLGCCFTTLTCVAKIVFVFHARLSCGH